MTGESARAMRPASPVTHLARIEVGLGELQKFLTDGVAEKIAGALKQIGYAHVTLDLQGYRRGSTNEVLSAGKHNGVGS
jgi:uncharacterized protein